MRVAVIDEQVHDINNMPFICPKYVSLRLVTSQHSIISETTIYI